MGNNNAQLPQKTNAKPTMNKFAPPHLKTNALCMMNNNAQLLPSKNVTCTTLRNAPPSLTRSVKLTLIKFVKLSQLRNAKLIPNKSAPPKRKRFATLLSIPLLKKYVLLPLKRNVLPLSNLYALKLLSIPKPLWLAMLSEAESSVE